MPKAQLRIAEEFSAALAQIYSDKLLARIRKNVEALAELPEIGSTNVRKSLTDLYGPNIRKIPISTFVIIYRYENNIVDILALVYGPTIV